MAVRFSLGDQSSARQPQSTEAPVKLIVALFLFAAAIAAADYIDRTDPLVSSSYADDEDE